MGTSTVVPLGQLNHYNLIKLNPIWSSVTTCHKWLHNICYLFSILYGFIFEFFYAVKGSSLFGQFTKATILEPSVSEPTNFFNLVAPHLTWLWERRPTGHQQYCFVAPYMSCHLFSVYFCSDTWFLFIYHLVLQYLSLLNCSCLLFLLISLWSDFNRRLTSFNATLCVAVTSFNATLCVAVFTFNIISTLCNMLFGIFTAYSCWNVCTFGVTVVILSDDRESVCSPCGTVECHHWRSAAEVAWPWLWAADMCRFQ